MIKLTRERIYEIAGGNRSTYEIARAIEAEVLRINGEAAAAERAACAELCRRLYDEEAADGYECQQAILARGNEPTASRATGCPDTMDDTGHFAEVDMPAFLKRQTS
jgi:hypothetical protein